jgi:phospholipid N-methyltransferase
MIYTATYSPDDNKLRLYASARLDAATYARVKAAGFSWAPKQELFVAPMWTPARAALLVELAGTIDDEDTTLAERAEIRAGRFDELSDKRANDSARAAEAVRAIADGIPLGQPILIGHHSERHARKDAERIESGMRKTVALWETAQYWKDRAAGAIRNAKYKERPDVRARRIARIEADLRKVEKTAQRAEAMLRAWAAPWERLRKKDGSAVTPREAVVYLANQDGSYYAAEHVHRSGYVGPLSLWEAAGGNINGADPDTVAIATPAEICERAMSNHRAHLANVAPWIDHYQFRLAYERAMLAADGGTVAQRTGPQKGGAVRCWASPRGGWSYIQKVNKVSVTVLDNWGNGGRNFTRTIPFDKLSAVMTPEEVDAARTEGRLIESACGCGFALCKGPEATEPEQPTAPSAPAAPDVDAMRASLAAGVTVATVPQLFPTPRDLAERMAEAADITEGCEVLEPSAGTGVLLGALGGRWHAQGGRAVAVEINAGLCNRLRDEFPLTDVRCADFLACNGDLGKFDRIVMNPPFTNGADIRHIQHARQFLKPGGRLVALCADGPRQREALQAMAEDSGGYYEPLPAGTFAAQGTGVNVALLVVES